jgi:hypothetical protein
VRLTVIGVLVVISTVALIAFVAYGIVQNSNRKQDGSDEQPINPS